MAGVVVERVTKVVCHIDVEADQERCSIADADSQRYGHANERNDSKLGQRLDA